MRKERVDVMLVEQGLAATREQAKRLVMAGLVYLGTEVVEKPGVKISADASLSVKGALHPFVSRGGLKLERALSVFPVDMEGRVVVDVGASTGGFTDCALRHGASLVYSVDVGYGQLAWVLRNDPRVRVMERTNFRHVDTALFDPMPDACVMDVSFISVVKILPKIKELLRSGSFVITLVKPQFEAGPESVGKGGIVREASVHLEVLRQVTESASLLGFSVEGLTYSPIKGGDGNIEFLLWLSRGDLGHASQNVDIASVVAEAHSYAD